MKDFIYKHFQSAGFQKRLKYIYLPLLKKGSAYLWNKYADKKELSIFADAYRNNPPVEHPEMFSSALSSPAEKKQLPLYENVADRLREWFYPSEEQGSTGQCVAFTGENIVKNIAKVIGLGKISLSPLDLYVDRHTRRFTGDYTGMNPSLMLQALATKGIAVGDLLPRMTDQSLMKDVDDRAFYPDALISHFRIKPLKAHQNIGRDFDTLVQKINSVPTGYPIQISLTCTDTYFGYDLPLATHTKEYGGHSVTAIGGSACIVDGKEGFFITDSAYYKNRVARFGVSIRFLTREFWEKYGGWSLYPIFNDEINAKAFSLTPPIMAKIEQGAKLGERSDNVAKIQLALIRKGEIIPSGATGFYGEETAKAVLSWQIKNVAKFNQADGRYTVTTLTELGGKNFGALSVKIINE